MSLDATIRDAQALAVLQIARAFGRTITLSNRGGTATTLYADWTQTDETSGSFGGIDTQETARVFFIPRQTGFEPAEHNSDGVLDLDDVITQGGKEYRVVRVKNGGNGNVYEADCVRSQARRVGP